MELYEYKITAMAHDERYALTSAKAAAERCTHLEHRLAQLTFEVNKMRQLLYRLVTIYVCREFTSLHSRFLGQKTA